MPTIVDWTRDTSLESIPTSKAYRMDAVHLYVDIPNLRGILETTASEGSRCHKRTPLFLNLHYRAVARVLAAAEARRVDLMTKHTLEKTHNHVVRGCVLADRQVIYER